MNSKSLQETVLDSQTLEELQKEIKQELIAVLNQSKLSKVLEKYGISNTEILKVQYTLDLNTIQPSDTGNSEQEIQPFFIINKPILEERIGLIRPCPIDNNPDGCWVG